MNKYYKGEPKLLVSVDCIVLGFENKKLQLLVGKRVVEPYSGKLSLYGGFVREDESLKEAANRVLYQCTGINNIYMRQVGAFGETDRDLVTVLSQSLIAHLSTSPTTTVSS